MVAAQWGLQTPTHINLTDRQTDRPTHTHPHEWTDGRTDGQAVKLGMLFFTFALKELQESSVRIVRGFA